MAHDGFLTGHGVHSGTKTFQRSKCCTSCYTDLDNHWSDNFLYDEHRTCNYLTSLHLHLFDHSI